MEIKRRFGDERRTEIAPVSGEVDVEDLIPKEDCVLTLTRCGYVKRQGLESYKLQKRGGRGVSGMSRREEDFASEMFVINTHDFVLFFTNKGRVYKLKCYEIPEGSRAAKGMNISNLIQVEKDEKVTSMIKVSGFEEDKFLVMLTKKGVIKRVSLNMFQAVRKGGIIAIELDENDELCWVKLTDGKRELIIATKDGKAIRFKEEDVRAVGRTARGVKALTLAESDSAAGMLVVEEGKKILTLSEKGFGRLSESSDYRVQARGGQGVINYHTKEYGKVALIESVGLDEDLIIISSDGVIIRIEANSIRLCSRPSKGVKVMKVSEGSKIVAMARVPHEDESENTESEKDEKETNEENREG